MITACLSDLRLDELLADELPVDAAAAAGEHLGDCRRCRDRKRELAAERARFRAAMPPLRRRRSRSVALAGGALAAAAVVALVVRGGNTGDGIRSKGGAHLGVVVVRGATMQRGGPGELTRPGDTLSYVVTTPEPAYVAVASRDGAGRITIYVPFEYVAAGRDIQLSVATVLDATLGRERLVAVFCPEPIAAALLHDAVDRDPPGCTVDRLAIEKVP
jgi:hypothetical protein